MAHRRWFLAGSILWLLTGIAHGIGQFAGGEGDVAYRGVVAVMRGYAVVPGGLTMFDFLQNLGLWACAMLGILAGLGATTLRACGDRPRAMRAFAAANAIGAAVLAAISGWFRFPPPILCFVLITLCFGLAWWSAPRDACA